MIAGANSKRKSMTIANESTTAAENVFVGFRAHRTATVTSGDHDYIIGPGNEKSWTFIEDGEDMRYSFQVVGSTTITISWGESNDA